MISLAGRAHTDADDFAFGMIRNAQDHVAGRKPAIPGNHLVALHDASHQRAIALATRVVCIVEGGILQEVLADAAVEVYHIDRDDDAATKEIRRRYRADVQNDDVDHFFDTPLTCDLCDPFQEGGARNAARHVQVGINEYNGCDECAARLNAGEAEDR